MRLTCLALSSVFLMSQVPVDPDAKPFIDGLQRIDNQDKKLQSDFDSKNSLFKSAIALNPKTASPSSRLYASSWLVRRNMFVGFSYSGNQSYLQVVRNQSDLQKAWDLLEQPSMLGREREQAQIRLEVAWRLMDLEKMRFAYDQVSKQPDLNPRELSHCIMVAAHLGEWESLQTYAVQARAKGMDLQGFHKAALNNLSSFDYESLLRAVETAKPKTERTPIAVRSYQIKNWRCRMNNISGADQALVGPITEQMKGAPKGWFNHAESTVLLIQVGAAAHWVESYAQPPVSGFIESDRLFLTCYRDSVDSKGKPARQNDFWDMKPDPTRPGFWTGTNTMIVPASGLAQNAPPSLQLVMDHEWQVVVQDDFLNIPAQNAPK